MCLAFVLPDFQALGMVTQVTMANQKANELTKDSVTAQKERKELT